MTRIKLSLIMFILYLLAPVDCCSDLMKPTMSEEVQDL